MMGENPVIFANVNIAKCHDPKWNHSLQQPNEVVEEWYKEAAPLWKKVLKRPTKDRKDTYQVHSRLKTYQLINKC